MRFYQFLNALELDDHAALDEKVDAMVANELPFIVDINDDLGLSTNGSLTQFN